jgi:centrosomal protein CEP164
MSEDPEYYEEDYEPELEEIIAYAEFIGMQLPEEEDLLWIAKEGLQAELPPDWE